jgi:hypothetical protein
MESRIWYFVVDMNSDGKVNFADCLLWLKWLFFYPGDFFVKLSLDFGLQNLIDILEITGHVYGGLISGIFSIFFWIFIFMLFD